MRNERRKNLLYSFKPMECVLMSEPLFGRRTVQVLRAEAHASTSKADEVILKVRIWSYDGCKYRDKYLVYEPKAGLDALYMDEFDAVPPELLLTLMRDKYTLITVL